MFVFVLIFFWGMCLRICYVHFCCQLMSWLHNYSSLWMITSGKWNWSFCAGICTDGVAAKTWRPSGFTNQVKRLLLNVNLCTVSSIEKCWLPEKCHLNLTAFFRMWLKLSTTLKYMHLTHVCSCSSVKIWTQSTHIFSYKQKWDGFLKVDYWPGLLSYESCSRDFFLKNSQHW